ncbi:MAG: biotin/lipoyl-containing protein [Nanobdellota archaeon]
MADKFYVSNQGGERVIGFNDSEETRDFVKNIIFFEFRITKGDKVKKEDELLSVESMEGTDNLRSPVDGEVTEVNDDVQHDPEMLANDPSVWLVKIKDE